MKILIVEDDDASKRVLQTTLEKAGYEVTAAEDGAQAWQMFDLKPVRVVISDWMMPELTGIDLCQKIRSRPLTEYTYFILLTARIGNDSYREAMAAGVDDFLGKPLSRDELFNRLHVAERILGLTAEVKKLKSILHVCMFCKKIRDDHNSWHQMEHYISTRTSIDFSHVCCPECNQKHLQPQLDLIRSRKRDPS